MELLDHMVILCFTFFFLFDLLKKLFLFFYVFYLFFGHAAFGILVPRPGIEPVPPALEAWSLNHWTAREVPVLLFEEPSCYLPQRLHHLAFPTAVHQSSKFLHILANTRYFPLLLLFFIIDILMGVKWYLIVLLICIPLLTTDLMAYWPFVLSSLEKCLFKSFAHFLTVYLLLRI